MKHLRKYALLSLLLSLCTALPAQVTVGQKIEPTTIRVGEQALLTITVTLDADERAYFPVFDGNMIAPGVEVVDASPVDTTWLNENRRMKLTRAYLVTSFDQDLYTLPPFEVKVGDSIYKAKDALGLKVDTAGINLDTLHLDNFYGPHGTVESVFEWNSLYFWLAVVVMCCFIGAVVLAVRYSNKRPITRRVVQKPAEQPHKWAIREIEKIKGEKTWNAEDAKDYYVRLTDILRGYIVRRFHFNAKEMTTAEIMEQLLKAKDENVLRELRQILETADLVKFAKYSASVNENDANLVRAIEFINETKSEAELPPQPVVREIVLKENKQMALRIAMAVGAIVLAVVAIGLIIYLASELYKSFL